MDNSHGDIPGKQASIHSCPAVKRSFLKKKLATNHVQQSRQHPWGNNLAEFPGKAKMTDRFEKPRTSVKSGHARPQSGGPAWETIKQTFKASGQEGNPGEQPNGLAWAPVKKTAQKQSSGHSWFAIQRATLGNNQADTDGHQSRGHP